MYVSKIRAELSEERTGKMKMIGGMGDGMDDMDMMYAC